MIPHPTTAVSPMNPPSPPVNPAARFIFRIGPFGAGSERYFMYFLQPGDPDHPGAAAVDDLAALRELVKVFPPADLVAEPALASAAAQYGIPVAPFDDHAAHALGLIALRLLPGHPVGELEREWTVDAMLRNARLLEERTGAAGAAGALRLRLDYVGALQWCAFGILESAAGRPCRLRLFSSRDDRESAVAAGPEPTAGRTPAPGPTALSVRFSVDREGARGAIADALRRSHGLESIPEPYLSAQGAATPLGDQEVMILAVALEAVSQVFQGHPTIESYTDVQGLGLGARLTLD